MQITTFQRNILPPSSVRNCCSLDECHGYIMVVGNESQWTEVVSHIQEWTQQGETQTVQLKTQGLGVKKIQPFWTRTKVSPVVEFITTHEVWMDGCLSLETCLLQIPPSSVSYSLRTLSPNSLKSASETTDLIRQGWSARRDWLTAL